MNRFWQDLRNEFVLNQDLESYIVLNEHDPSINFRTFATWAIQISYMLAQVVADLKRRNAWQSTRHFLDLTDTTYSELLASLDAVLGGPSTQRNQIFPLPPEEANRHR